MLLLERLRKFENLHILFWLMKDTCWAFEWKIPGVIMIFPTLSLALYLTWINRENRTELTHNIAVTLWILANSTWMIGEFYDVDLRPYAAIIFSAGLSILIVFYLLQWIRNRKAGSEETNA